MIEAKHKAKYILGDTFSSLLLPTIVNGYSNYYELKIYVIKKFNTKVKNIMSLTRNSQNKSKTKVDETD